MISFDSAKLMLRSSSMAQKKKKNRRNEQTGLDGCIDVGIIANAQDARRLEIYVLRRNKGLVIIG